LITEDFEKDIDQVFKMLNAIQYHFSKMVRLQPSQYLSKITPEYFQDIHYVQEQLVRTVGSPIELEGAFEMVEKMHLYQQFALELRSDSLVIIINNNIHQTNFLISMPIETCLF
jgi:hypothetical protein